MNCSSLFLSLHISIFISLSISSPLSFSLSRYDYTQEHDTGRRQGARFHRQFGGLAFEIKASLSRCDENQAVSIRNKALFSGRDLQFIVNSRGKDPGEKPAPATIKVNNYFAEM